jgi:hypothetical protein
MRTPSYLSKIPDAIKQAKSYAEAFRIMGVSKTVKGSGNYKTIKNWVKKLGLDISHFDRHTPSCPGKSVTFKSDEQFVKDNLFKGKPYTTSVREGIVKRKILPYKCDECGNEGEWNGKKLTLQIDHIDGDNDNNEICNLHFLCPNCHSQTITYAGAKNKIEKPKGIIKPRASKRKTVWPDRDVLIELVKTMPMRDIAQRYCVTDNAVRKWCKNYAIDHKSLSPFSHHKSRLSSDIQILQKSDARSVPEATCHFTESGQVSSGC